MPQAPVAGFTQDQMDAFQRMRDQSDIAQPYMQRAGSLFEESAMPVGEMEVNRYLNPYANFVMGNLQDVFGSQMRQITGNLTQSAGGVGADRIAVGQSELARKQGLAGGQTMANLYQQALAAAQQDRGRQQSAAFGLGQLGPAAQNAAFAGTQGLYNFGNLQQQHDQAMQNAHYARQVQQIRDPMEKAQFLAGITGGLAPAMGGTTSGVMTQTAPPPSMLSQVLGIGTAAAGGVGMMGGFGNQGWANPWGGNWMGTGSGAFAGDYGGSPESNPNLVPVGWAARGGRINPYASGGAVMDMEPGPDGVYVPSTPINAPQDMLPDGNIPVSRPSQGAQLQWPSPGGGGQKSDGTAEAIQTAAKLAMMFIKRGGRVNPYEFGGRVYPEHAGESFQTGGSLLPQVRPRPGPREEGDSLTRMLGFGGGESGGPPGMGFAQMLSGARPMGFAQMISGMGKADGGEVMPSNRWWGTQEAEEAGIYEPSPVSVTGAGPDLVPVGTTEPAPPSTMALPAPPMRQPIGGAIPPPVPSRGESPSLFAQPSIRESDDTTAKLAANPWLALVMTGAKMAAGTSPHAGVNIGQGIAAGAEHLGKQRQTGMQQRRLDMDARRVDMEAKRLYDHLQTSDLQRTVMRDNLQTSALNRRRIELQNRVGEIGLTALEEGHAALRSPELLEAMGLTPMQAAVLGPEGMRAVVQQRLLNKYDIKEVNGEVFAIDRLDPTKKIPVHSDELRRRLLTTQARVADIALEALEGKLDLMKDPAALDAMGLTEAQAKALGADGVQEVLKQRILNKYQIVNNNQTGEIWAIDPRDPTKSIRLRTGSGLEAYGIPGSGPPGSPPAPVNPNQTTSTAPQSQGEVVPNYEGAYGPVSVLHWAGAKVQGAWSGSISQRQAMTMRADAELQNLGNRVSAAIAHEMPGDRLKLVQEEVRKLLPKPGQFWTSAPEAVIKLTELRKRLDKEIERNKTTLEAPAYQRATKDKAGRAYLEQVSARDNINDIISDIKTMPKTFKLDRQGRVFVPHPDGRWQNDKGEWMIWVPASAARRGG